MKTESHLIDHYIQLQNEIDRFSESNIKLLIASIAATGTILTVGFTTNNPINVYVFFCTFLFIIPISKIVIGHRMNVWRISTYLRVFIEPKLEDVKWETRLFELRKENMQISEVRNLVSRVVSNEIHIITLLSFVSMFSIVIMHCRHVQEYYFENVIASLLAIFSIICFFYLLISNYRANKELCRGGKIEEDYLKSWMRLAKKEEE